MSLAASICEVEIRLIHGAGTLGPVTCGIPWPRGALRDHTCLSMRDARGRDVALQTRVLDRWPDGSVRWVLLDWIAQADSALFRLVQENAPHVPVSKMRRESFNDSVKIDTGAAAFELDITATFPFRQVFVRGAPTIDPARCRFAVEDESGRVYLPRLKSITVDESGPVRALVRMQGDLANGSEALADFDARLHFFADSTSVRCEFNIRNPRASDHPGGLWDLGNGGSI